MVVILQHLLACLKQAACRSQPLAFHTLILTNFNGLASLTPLPRLTKQTESWKHDDVPSRVFDQQCCRK